MKVQIKNILKNIYCNRFLKKRINHEGNLFLINFIIILYLYTALILINFIKKEVNYYLNIMGIGDWGLGNGDWG